jgi:hypothetical protein
MLFVIPLLIICSLLYVVDHIIRYDVYYEVLMLFIIVDIVISRGKLRVQKLKTPCSGIGYGY